MLYSGSEVIRDVEWVVFDEVHYINDTTVCEILDLLLSSSQASSTLCVVIVDVAMSLCSVVLCMCVCLSLSVVWCGKR